MLFNILNISVNKQRNYKESNTEGVKSFAGFYFLQFSLLVIYYGIRSSKIQHTSPKLINSAFKLQINLENISQIIIYDSKHIK